MNHAHLPAGVDGQTRELHLGFPILVFNFRKEGNIEQAVVGDRVGTLILPGRPLP